MSASVALLLGVQLAGCAPLELGLNGPAASKDVPVTQAAMPSVIRPYARIDDTLYCIRDTGVIAKMTFVVGSFADSTGKINSVSVGSTGAFVPQGGSAAYLTDAITKAGGRVVSTYFGAPAVRAPAQYAVNGIFNSLDFGTPYMADVRVGGVGPMVRSGWAQLSLSIQLDEAGTRLNRQMSMVQRPVKFSQAGAGVGKVWNDNLVTGFVGVQNQERLQFEALNGPIALGVADVLLKEFPAARQRCGQLIDDLLNPPAEGDTITAIPDRSRRPPPTPPGPSPSPTRQWNNTGLAPGGRLAVQLASTDGPQRQADARLPHHIGTTPEDASCIQT